MSNGKIVQVMGPVVDVEFESGDLPEVLTALKTTNASINDKAENLTIGGWTQVGKLGVIPYVASI